MHTFQEAENEGEPGDSDDCGGTQKVNNTGKYLQDLYGDRKSTSYVRDRTNVLTEECALVLADDEMIGYLTGAGDQSTGDSDRWVWVEVEHDLW